MVMAVEGAFDYVFDVSTVEGAAGPLQGRLREPLSRTDRRRGMPGRDESLSIERRGVCPDTAAHTTAQLLEAEGVELGAGPVRAREGGCLA